MKNSEVISTVTKRVSELFPRLSHELGEDGLSVTFFSKHRPERKLRFRLHQDNSMSLSLPPYFELPDQTVDLELAVRAIEALANGSLKAKRLSGQGRLVGYIVNLRLRNGTLLEYRTPFLHEGFLRRLFRDRSSKLHEIVQVERPDIPDHQSDPPLCWELAIEESNLTPTY